MYLSTLKLWNFRKYCEGPNGEPGLEVHFHEGVNVLIGENNSGKTAIVDAMLSNTSKNVSVYGHSLGGGLMQFACAGNSTTRVHGYGYNSAGLSASTCGILSKRGAYVQLNNIVFINASTDIVSKIGTFLGERVSVDTAGVNMMGAHKIETLNIKINTPMLYC